MSVNVKIDKENNDSEEDETFDAPLHTESKNGVGISYEQEIISKRGSFSRQGRRVRRRVGNKSNKTQNKKECEA